MLNIFAYLSYKAQFLLWGQYWQVCLLVRMSGSRDNRLFSPCLSTQFWTWWIKVFLSFSNSDRDFFLEKVMEAPCDKLWSACECTCTSVVHVAGHYRVEIPILEVEKKSSFRPVSFQAHQSVKNDLHREKTKLNKLLTWSIHCPRRWQCCSPKPDCDALWSWIPFQFSAPAEWSSLLGFCDSVHFVVYGSELVQKHLFSLSIQILATKHFLLYLPARWI